MYIPLSKIIGVDPGGTTGFCICKCIPGKTNVTLQILDNRSETHGFQMVDVFTKLLIIHKPDLIVIESVVRSGQLTKDKVVQIQAHDRVRVVAHSRQITVEEVTPQAVKKIKEVPVSGTAHERDAYRVICAYFMARGLYEPSDINTEKTERWDTGTVIP